MITYHWGDITNGDIQMVFDLIFFILERLQGRSTRIR